MFWVLGLIVSAQVFTLQANAVKCLLVVRPQPSIVWNLFLRPSCALVSAPGGGAEAVAGEQSEGGPALLKILQDPAHG